MTYTEFKTKFLLLEEYSEWESNLALLGIDFGKTKQLTPPQKLYEEVFYEIKTRLKDENDRLEHLLYEMNTQERDLMSYKKMYEFIKAG